MIDQLCLKVLVGLGMYGARTTSHLWTSVLSSRQGTRPYLAFDVAFLFFTGSFLAE